MNSSRTLWIILVISLLQWLPGHSQSVFRKSNLTAWCVVPFDALERGPDERAKMLRELGIKRLAYDWREEHIPTFDDELKALRKNKIKLQAFWMSSDFKPQGNAQIKAIFDFLERNKVKTEIWLLVGTGGEEFNNLTQTEKIRKVAEPIRYIAEKASQLGCKVGLYNHGGWFGEPENQLEIINHLGLSNIGIVYNFHHAREHHQRFSEFYPKMMPHLLSLNIAGLKSGDTQKFYRTGEGDVETEMIRLVARSNYSGPIGIINHDMDEDAAVGLQQEIDGLRTILHLIGDTKASKTYP